MEHIHAQNTLAIYGRIECFLYAFYVNIVVEGLKHVCEMVHHLKLIYHDWRVFIQTQNISMNMIRKYKIELKKQQRKKNVLFSLT